MKNSQAQIYRLLKGYSYCVCAKILRNDDPANRPRLTQFENRAHTGNFDFYNDPIQNKTEKNDHASMYVIELAESRIGIDEISFFVTTGGVHIHLFRRLGGIKIDSCYVSFMGEKLVHHPQLARIEPDLNRKIRDEIVWSDFGTGFDSTIVKQVVLDYDSMSDDGLIIGIATNKACDVSELPTLSKLDKALDGVEKIVRDCLYDDHLY